MPDHARPLNLRGRHAAQVMAKEIRRLGLMPDFVAVSSARRTLQTLAALEPWDTPPVIELMDTLYLADAEDMLDILRRTPATARRVLLVGHNPGLQNLAVMLAGAHAAAMDQQVRRVASGYPSGALAQFEVASAWPDLDEGGGRLTRFLLPGDLPEMDA